ncbi:MAG: beta galactosidase jelly roll domain-containing protein [Anaerolineae bacterium]|nr:beta galactosidase jelly roll domain-containing protein [Anaerolineae bacterium]
MLDIAQLMNDYPGEGLAKGYYLPDFDDTNWLQTDVPGDVHRTLIAAEKIPDPYYDRNESQCEWMEEQEWWYRLRFQAEHPTADNERVLLRFNGLDTFATIWLNGEELGKTANMFRAFSFDITEKLNYGVPNVLAICFDPPLAYVDQGRLPEFSSWGRNPERVFMRKAQFGYGWDWGPRLPTIGVWLPVELVRQYAAALDDVYFYTLEIDKEVDHALVSVRVEVDRFASDNPLNAKIRLIAPDGSVTVEETREMVPGAASITAYLDIAQPELWWTHDLGTPSLYTLEVTLAEGETILDQDARKVGIRMLTVDQSPDTDEPGTRFFRFVLNGVPVFARGGDWIPADSFVGAIPDELYERLLTMARDANMTIVRVWGGGIYEHEIFYNLCDKLGMLVWQDFMFACAMYPEYDPDFVENVTQEAIYQVRRLRGHACLGLWCGNNENQWLHETINWDKLDSMNVSGALYYHKILPRVVAELDRRTTYWPGSPFGGNDHADQRDGNRHNWEVWHGNSYNRRFGDPPKRDALPTGASYRRYAEDMGRFISEFGMHAAPVVETLRRVIPPHMLYHHSESMDHHNKDNPKNKGDNLMLAVTGLPETLEEYIDYSMIAQAEGLKFGIEHFRRRKPHCSGTIVWQLNDCWPVLSWSVIDSYGFGKAGYYYLRRVYAPVIASFHISSEGVELWVVNDSLKRVEDSARITLGTFGGETLHEIDLPVQVPANTAHRVCAWSSDELAPGADRYLWVSAANGSFEDNHEFFEVFKDVQRVAELPSMEVTLLDECRAEVTLSAKNYVYFANLSYPDERTTFSDNYIDIQPGGKRVITMTTPTPIDLEKLELKSR